MPESPILLMKKCSSASSACVSSYEKDSISGQERVKSARPVHGQCFLFYQGGHSQTAIALAFGIQLDG
jgi:hypothetical protein